MSDKKIYKILATVAFVTSAIFSWFDLMIAITGFLIAIYNTLWAILSHLEEKK